MNKYLKQQLFFIIGLVLALSLAGCSQQHEFAGTQLDPPRPATNFMGTNWDGSPFHLRELQGQVVLLFFGYTSCPDVCPTTLAEMRSIKQQLGEHGEKLAVVLVTIDPERDTVERLAQYVPAFDSTFYGVILDEATLSNVKEAYGIYAEKVEDTAQPASYVMDHSGYTLLIDPDGNWRGVYAYDTTAEAIVADIRYILSEE
jgi:protein SCO1